MLEEEPQLAAIDPASLVQFLCCHLHIVASGRADEREGTGELPERSNQISLQPSKRRWFGAA